MDSKEWCPCGYARRKDGVLVITSISPYCEEHSDAARAAQCCGVVEGEAHKCYRQFGSIRRRDDELMAAL